MILPSLRQLRFLVYLQESLHFSNAAKRCHVTQSTLSAGLKELEIILGVTLAERTKRSVIMTPIGNKVADKARKILAEVEELVEIAEMEAGPLSGGLRLGVIPTIGPFLLPLFLPMLRTRFPGIRLYLREELTDSLLDGLRAGRIDVALVALPYDVGDCTTKILFDDGYHLVTPKQDPLAHEKTIDGKMLESHHLMLLEKGHCLQQHALSAFPGLLHKDLEFEATSLPTLLAMVEEGLGMTLIPNMAIDAGLTRGHDLALKELPQSFPRQIALIWRKSSARQNDFEILADLLTSTRKKLADRAAA